MGDHRLDILLKPASVAIVGASAKPGSFGNDVVRVLAEGGFRGAIYPVNPSYDEVDGRRCYAGVAALPAKPDLAILAVAGTRLEAAMDEAIAGGARSLAVFDSCYVENDRTPPLLERLKEKARVAGVPLCGGNGMGFYNFDAATHASFQHPPRRPAGTIALIAHSGSVFVLLAANDPRYRFNLVVSAGQEINGTVADYMDFALAQPSTRVIALFIETVRDVPGFVAALEKARRQAVPVVAMKVGRTEESARLAATHSGAIAGNDAAYEALFDRHGVLRAETLDELMATALLLSMPKRPAPGGLAGVTDSGGLRELLIDLADREGVPFAHISPETEAKLRLRLPHGLEAANPLDAAGPLKGDYAEVFKDCLQHLLDDAATALASFEFEVRDDFVYMPRFLEICEAFGSSATKPFVVVNSFSAAQNSQIAVRLLEAGIPMINGAQTMLQAVRHALAYRDWLARPPMVAAQSPGADIVTRWRACLSRGGTLGEAQSLSLLADFGVPAATERLAGSAAEALAAARAVGFPVVLKTAAPGIHHKSDVDGVKLHLAGEAAVLAAYEDLARRLGPEVAVAPMIRGGVELAFGMTTDSQLGPLVMVGSGGTWIELLRDRVFALPPFDAAEARRMIDRLQIRALLDGGRGTPPADIASLCDALARFSVLAAELADSVAEIDVNPLVARAAGPIALDALVVARARA